MSSTMTEPFFNTPSSSPPAPSLDHFWLASSLSADWKTKWFLIESCQIQVFESDQHVKPFSLYCRFLTRIVSSGKNSSPLFETLPSNIFVCFCLKACHLLYTFKVRFRFLQQPWTFRYDGMLIRSQEHSRGRVQLNDNLPTTIVNRLHCS